MLEQFANADESVDSHGQETGADAELLDARKESILHCLVVEQA